MTEEGLQQNTVSDAERNECGGLWSSLKGMFSFYTMLPINIGYAEMNAMNKRFWLAPVAGVFFGVLAMMIYMPLQHYVNSMIAAACALFVIHFVNRYLHLDGMIDIGDGLTVAGKREDHLRALKDTRIGAGGMVTGLFVVLITFACYTSLDVMFVYVGFMAEVFARNAQVVAAGFGKPGNGMAGEQVRLTDIISVVMSTSLSIAFVATFFILFDVVFGGYSPFKDVYVIALAVSVLISVVWGWIMSKIAEKNFGMVNGDVLGATNESSRVWILVASIITLSVVVP